MKLSEKRVDQKKVLLSVRQRMKKLTLAVLLFIIITIIFMLSPYASGAYEVICKQQLKTRFDIQANFENFQIQPFKKINCTKIILNKGGNQIKAEEAVIKIIDLKPFSNYFEIRLESKKLEIANINAKMLPLVDIISKQTDSDILKSVKLNHVNFNLVKDKKKVKIYDIEAVGDKLKVHGAVDIVKDRAICNLTLYIPTEKTENMPKFSKILLGMKQEGDWSIFRLRNIPFRIK